MISKTRGYGTGCCRLCSGNIKKGEPQYVVRVAMVEARVHTTCLMNWIKATDARFDLENTVDNLFTTEGRKNG